MTDKAGKRGPRGESSDQPTRKKLKMGTNELKPEGNTAVEDEGAFLCSLCKGPTFAGKQEIQDHISSMHGKWFTERWMDYCTDGK